MKLFNHLFVIDPLEKLNKKLDSSLRMAFSLSRRGHNIYIATPKDISWSMDAGVARLKAQQLKFNKDNFEINETLPECEKLLSEFDAIYMRKDPPFDMDYITCTWLLETAEGTSRIYNSPSALRSYNEKLLGLSVSEYCNTGLVSTSSEELEKFIIDKCNGDAIIKPLDLFGGKGIERLNLEELGHEELRSKLKEHTEKGLKYRLVQPFQVKIFEGELRVFTFMGEIIAVSKKVPAQGNYLANTSAGATVEDVDLKPELKKNIQQLSTKLIDKGVFMVGYDIIGDLVSEINITSPRLLAKNVDDFENFDRIAELVENDLLNFTSMN